MIKTLAGKITQAIDEMESKLLKGYTKPQDRLLASAFFWNEMKKRCESQQKTAFEAFQEALFIEKEKLEPGIHEKLAQSPHFQLNAEVTQPYKNFDASELAQVLLKGKHHVPVAVTLEAIEAAKVEGKSRVTFKLVERNA